MTFNLGFYIISSVQHSTGRNSRKQNQLFKIQVAKMLPTCLRIFSFNFDFSKNPSNSTQHCSLLSVDCS